MHPLSVDRALTPKFQLFDARLAVQRESQSIAKSPKALCRSSLGRLGHADRK